MSPSAPSSVYTLHTLHSLAAPYCVTVTLLVDASLRHIQLSDGLS